MLGEEDEDENNKGEVLMKADEEVIEEVENGKEDEKEEGKLGSKCKR